MKNKTREIPLGINILSVLYYVTAGLSILFSILFIIGGILFLTNPGLFNLPLNVEDVTAGLPPDVVVEDVVSNLPLLNLILSWIGWILIVLAVLLIGASILDYFIARGLRRGKNWTRILLLIFSALGIVGGLVSLFKGNFINIIGIVISGAIGYYLYFVKEVKEFFS